MSDALLDILYITPDILGEGLDRIKVVEENIAGVVQDAVNTILLFLEQTLFIISHLYVPDFFHDWVFAQLESVFIRGSPEDSYLMRENYDKAKTFRNQL